MPDREVRDEIGGRQLLQALMERSGENPNSLATKLKNRSIQSGLHRYLSGSTREPKRATIQPVAEHFGVDVEAFYSDKIARETAGQLGLLADVYPVSLAQESQVTQINGGPANSDNPMEECVIVQWHTGGSMGSGLLLRDQPGVIRSWTVSREWVQKNIPHCTSVSNLTIVTGFGDSMKGMFNSGDPLIVDTGVRNVDFDAVYFFRIGAEGFIKRLQRMPGPDGMRIKVKSKNPDYEDWFIESKMDLDFQVFGRVVKVWQGENL